MPVRSLVRRSEAAATLPANVDVVTGYLTVPESLDAGLRGVGAVFLVWTALFASNALHWWASAIRADGVVRWPYGDAETAPVDDRDVAAVAALTLHQGGHAGRDYVLTGAESLSQAEDGRRDRSASGSPITPPRSWTARPVDKPETRCRRPAEGTRRQVRLRRPTESTGPRRRTYSVQKRYSFPMRSRCLPGRGDIRDATRIGSSLRRHYDLRRPLHEGSCTMAKVVAIMSMSLDGFVADANDGVAEVFDWYFSGDVEVPTASTTSGMTFQVSPPSAEHLRGLMAEIGAMLTGRRTFDVAGGWDGQHPFDVPAFVVTHRVPEGWPRPGSTVQFVTDGIESAVARARSAAGPKSVGVHGAHTIQQCLAAGLLDEIHVDLAAVLLGSGVRLFDHLADAPVVLGDPTVVTGVGVTHLRYRVHTS